MECKGKIFFNFDKIIFELMNIEIWSIGKESDAYIRDGILFFQKRIKPYCNVQLAIIAPPKRSVATSPEESILLEEKIILDKLTSSHYLIVLDERGKQYTSKAFAEQLQQIMNTGPKTIVILIGGPWGISETIKQRAQKIISLSNFTFPHQLVRIIMFEQLYRAFSILNNGPYHHE